MTTDPAVALRFPGQWANDTTQLHQNWMRYYDPVTGRYVQADPLGLVDGASVYGYALQNPGRYVDPRGEKIQPPGTGGAACNYSDKCVVVWTDNRHAAPGNGLFILKPGQCTGTVKPWKRDVGDFIYHDGEWFKCRAFGTCNAHNGGRVSQSGWYKRTDNKPTWESEGSQSEMNTRRLTPMAEELLREECRECLKNE